MIMKGQKINDRYQIIKSIGEGGMANVYLAYDTILEREVAVKILRGDLSEDEKFVRRFQREANSASSLKHPKTYRNLSSIDRHPGHEKLLSNGSNGVQELVDKSYFSTLGFLNPETEKILFPIPIIPWKLCPVSIFFNCFKVFSPKSNLKKCFGF